MDEVQIEVGLGFQGGGLGLESVKVGDSFLVVFLFNFVVGSQRFLGIYLEEYFIEEVLRQSIVVFQSRLVQIF